MQVMAPFQTAMDITKCPVCKCPVRIARRKDGAADHYEPLTIQEIADIPNPCPPALSDYLRAKRRGKKTVALIGSVANTGPWTPFGEEGLEIWTCNELHGLSWMKEEFITAWFQLHPKWHFKDRIHNHWEWLQKEHSFPIYMNMVYDSVPNSVRYPLHKIKSELVNIVRGELPLNKIFSSTMCYQVALALIEGFKRIEFYGIELLFEAEYAYQREGMAYWLGKADGMGVEVWMPEQCSLLVAPLYAYEEIRKGDTGEIEKPPDDYEDERNGDDTHDT